MAAVKRPAHSRLAYTTTEAAALLGVSDKALQAWMREGLIKPVIVRANFFLVEHAELVAFLERRRAATKADWLRLTDGRRSSFNRGDQKA